MNSCARVNFSSSALQLASRRCEASGKARAEIRTRGGARDARVFEQALDGGVTTNKVLPRSTTSDPANCQLQD